MAERTRPETGETPEPADRRAFLIAQRSRLWQFMASTTDGARIAPVSKELRAIHVELEALGAEKQRTIVDELDDRRKARETDAGIQSRAAGADQ
jgi:hypothetical protein